MPGAALAGTEGGATGTFANNNTPTITSVQLWNISGPAEVTAMTPQVVYDVRVKVTDADGLTDLTTIVVKIYYDDATEGTTEAEYDGKTANTQTCAIITWTQATDLFSIDPSASTTWGFTEGDCVTGTADSVTAFQFKFTVGKVATEATGGIADDWQIAAKVTDDSAETAWAADAEGSTMAWYGEITVPTATADWGTVNPGMDFAEDGSSEEALGVAINYISNGAYDEKVKSSTVWTGASYNGTLATDGVTDVAQEFALKADDTGTLASAVVVDATGATIDESGTLTAEAGDDAAANALWLKLASTFSKDTYSGTITYIIADGS